MIDLYAAGTSNGMRARMALEECGLAYTFDPVALAKGEHKTPEVLAGLPHLERWASEMGARPAMQRALQF